MPSNATAMSSFPKTIKNALNKKLLLWLCPLPGSGCPFGALVLTVIGCKVPLAPVRAEYFSSERPVHKGLRRCKQDNFLRWYSETIFQFA
jgi:hypothetical protein